MPIYKDDGSGKFVPFEETKFEELEKILENWIENNAHIVLDGENIAIFARQPRTSHNKLLDLLGVDKTGATVIVELKRGETPRDVVAQTLEYAAWVDSLTPVELDEMARDYASKKGLEADNLADIYALTFPAAADEGEDDEDEGSAERVTFNNSQRLVIVAEKISGEVEQTLRYLRTRFDVDVHGVEFSIHKAGNDTLVNTTTVVGRESKKGGGARSRRGNLDTDEDLVAQAGTDFRRRAVTSIEDWVGSLNVPGLLVEHGTNSRHRLKYQGDLWVGYSYPRNWLRMSLYGPSSDELSRLRALSKPEELRLTSEQPRQGRWRFHVATDADLDIVKQIIFARLAARGVAVEGALR